MVAIGFRGPPEKLIRASLRRLLQCIVPPAIKPEVRGPVRIAGPAQRRTPLTPPAPNARIRPPMSQQDTLHLAQEFLRLMGSGAEPADIARLFSESLEWEIAGDTGVLPWIGHKTGRSAITDFVNDSRRMIERITF